MSVLFSRTDWQILLDCADGPERARMTARFGEAVLQMKREGTGTATERLSLTALKAYLQDAPNEVAVNAITALSASPVQLTLLPAWVAVTPGLMQALLLDATRIWARLGTSPDNLGLETACTYLVHSWAALDYNTTVRGKQDKGTRCLAGVAPLVWEEGRLPGTHYQYMFS